jgi:DNA-binding CsgD family transcriptional regulator
MALNGETDWQLADRMKTSLHSVKKLWRIIYGRADLGGQRRAVNRKSGIS